MGLTSALNTALNGLSLNETAIDVLGNNIANAGTNGFKSSEVLFESQLARTLSVGSRSTATNGGTNPRQIGLGASVSTIRKNFSQGSVTNSTSPSDLAIQGDGFFVLAAGEDRLYSRAGNFSLNSSNFLVNAQGFFVQGYGINEDNTVNTTGELQNIQINLGTDLEAQATTLVEIEGSILPTGTVGTRGTVSSTAQLFSDAVATGGAATAATNLVNVEISDGGGGFTNLFTAGTTLTFQPSKGGRTVDAKTLDVTATTTITDLMTLLGDTLGIHSDPAEDGSIPQVLDDTDTLVTPGVSFDATNGITIVGNEGTVHDFSIISGALTSDNTAAPTGTPTTIGLDFTKAQSANGESTITDFVMYDEQGTALNTQLTVVLEEVTPNQTRARYYLNSTDFVTDDDPSTLNSTAVSNGVLVFGSDGEIVDGQTSQVVFNRGDVSASDQTITLDFNNVVGIASSGTGSTLNLGSQNGSSTGTLSSFVIDESGIVNGVYDNGVIRSLGQVVLATFPNNQGLVEAGSTTFREGISSGTANTVIAGTEGAGTIRAGAVELSNTDIGAELIDLITASTNYRGNARVISSVQELVDELLVLGR